MAWKRSRLRSVGSPVDVVASHDSRTGLLDELTNPCHASVAWEKPRERERDIRLKMNDAEKLHIVQGLECKELIVEIKGGDVDAVNILEATEKTQHYLWDVVASKGSVPSEVSSGLESQTSDSLGLMLWPSASAVAKYLLELVTDLSNQTVLEIGAGTGVVSLAVSHLAKQVVASDYEAAPLALLRYAANHLNPKSNNISTTLFDLRDFSMELPPADIVVAADVLYNPSNRKAMAQRVSDAIERGSRVVIGDPGRAGTLEFLEELSKLRGNSKLHFSKTMETSGTHGSQSASVALPVSILDSQA